MTTPPPLPFPFPPGVPAPGQAAPQAPAPAAPSPPVVQTAQFIMGSAPIPGAPPVVPVAPGMPPGLPGMPPGFLKPVLPQINEADFLNTPKKNGVISLYGPPKVGKTTAALETAQGVIMITNDNTGAGMFENFLRLPKYAIHTDRYERGLCRPPLKFVLLDKAGLYIADNVCSIAPRTRPVFARPDLGPIPRLHLLRQLVDMWTQQVKAAIWNGQPLPFHTLFFDETTSLWDDFLVEIAEGMTYGTKNPDGSLMYEEHNPHGMAHHGYRTKWTTKLLSDLKSLTLHGVSTIIGSHSRESDEKTKKRGGPLFGTQAMMAALGGKADLLLKRDFGVSQMPGQPTPRIWTSFAEADEISGVRGIPDYFFEIFQGKDLAFWTSFAGYVI